MKRPRFWVGVGTISAVAMLAWFDRLWAEDAKAPQAASRNAVQQADRTKGAVEDEAAQIAKLIDSVIQPRFSKDAGEFGLRRLASLNGHEPVIFTAEDKTESAVLEKVHAFGKEYFIAFLHMAHKPGRYSRPAVGNDRPGGRRAGSTEVKPSLSPILTARNFHPKNRDKLSKDQWSKLLKLTTDRLQDLRKGEDASASFEKWTVNMRPVVAQKACLDCHEGAKEGEALGVMLYGVEGNAAERATQSAE